jgi:hypothetical protein
VSRCSIFFPIHQRIRNRCIVKNVSLGEIITAHYVHCWG